MHENSRHHNTCASPYLRDNGGLDNWTMVFTWEMNCADNQDAYNRERKYIDNLIATFNTCTHTCIHNLHTYKHTYNADKTTHIQYHITYIHT